MQWPTSTKSLKKLHIQKKN